MRSPLRLPLGPRVASPVAKMAGVLAGLLVAAAVAVAMTGLNVWARAGLALALVALAGVTHHVVSRRRRPPAGWLTVDEQGVKRPGDRPLVDWRDPLGVTVLGSADRARFVLALTSPRATRLLAVRVLDAGDAAEAPSLLDRAVTAPEADQCAADAERLLAAFARRSPGALDRVFLSDASGEPVVLDRTELRVGARRIDLTAPLEWRAYVFEELGAHAASVCQAIAMRQGDGEVVLVAPWTDGGAAPPGPSSEPPPRDVRRAVDRLFMAPLRRALERAPRVSRAPAAASRPGPRTSSP
jgi:hypothetical protein